MEKAGVPAAHAAEVGLAVEALAREADKRIEVALPQGVDTLPADRVKDGMVAVVDAFLPAAVGALQMELRTNPTKFLDHFEKFLEYVTPKLARSEQKVDIQDSRTFVPVEQREAPPIELEKLADGTFGDAPKPE